MGNYTKVKKWFSFAALILVFGCTSEPEVEVPEAVKSLDNVTVHSPDMEPTREVVLEEEVTYEDTEEVIHGSILRNVEVDEQGRVYIPDYQAKVVHAYNADGSYLDSIGRQGRGPGEFQMIWKIRVANGNLHVLDYMYQKMSVFDLQAMDHIRDVSLSLNEETDAPPSWLDQTRKKKLSYKPIDFYVRSDGNYLIFFGDEAVGSVDNVEGRTYEVSLYDPLEKKYLKHDLLSFAWTGQTLIDQEGETVMFRVPYKRSSRFAYSGKELIHGWTEDLLFKTYNEEGQYQRAFFHPDPEISLKVEDALARYQNSRENVVKAIRNDTHPETWPAFNTIKPDDEHRLWVSVYTDDLKMYEWWVLDAENGELLTRFEWPKEKQIEVIKSGKLYIRERDKETGLEEVVRYGINMGEKE